MRVNAVRELLALDRVAANAWLTGDGAHLAEVVSHLGFDAATVDLQHGVFGLDGAVGLLRAVSAGPAVPMARCSSLDPAQIGKLLDAGAYGIICPDVSSAEQCAQLVAACRYPPTGRRSYGPARGLLHGGPDYVERADETVLVWAMVESVAALAQLDTILAVPGLDGVFVGPVDLGLSLGLRPSRRLEGEVADAVRHVAARARAHGVAAGGFCPTADDVPRLVEWGYRLVTAGTDVTMLQAGAAPVLAAVRGEDGR